MLQSSWWNLIVTSISVFSKLVLRELSPTWHTQHLVSMYVLDGKNTWTMSRLPVIFCVLGLACLLHVEALLKALFHTTPGFRSENVTLTSLSVKSQLRCASACARDPLCSGYNYHCATRDQCELLCGGGNETAQKGWTVGYLNTGKNKIIILTSRYWG